MKGYESMIIKSKFNMGKDLREYEDRTLSPDQFGKFGASEYTNYGFNIGEEFFVVGMILQDGNLRYLINDGRVVGIYPYQLFEVIDPRFPSGWFFNSFASNNTQALWGYYEWCFDHKKHYEDLIEMEEEAHLVFFKHKIEFEKSLVEEF